MMIKTEKIPIDFETGFFEQFVQAKVGDTIRLLLDSNPSTGFNWGFIKEPQVDEMEMKEEKFTLPNQKLLGAPGVYELHYLAKAKGKFQLQMEYKQFFAPESGLIKAAFHFDIND